MRYRYSFVLYLLFRPIDLMSKETSLNLDFVAGFYFIYPFPGSPLNSFAKINVSSVK